MRETERQSATLPSEVTQSLDVVFDLLANRRRRYALYYLYERTDGVATIDDVVEYVVTLERRCDEACYDPAQVKTSLRHVHLPKLEDAGVLEHDARSEMIRYWGPPSIEEWLEHAHHKEGV